MYNPSRIDLLNNRLSRNNMFISNLHLGLQCAFENVKQLDVRCCTIETMERFPSIDSWAHCQWHKLWSIEQDYFDRSWQLPTFCQIKTIFLIRFSLYLLFWTEYGTRAWIWNETLVLISRSYFFRIIIKIFRKI